MGGPVARDPVERAMDSFIPVPHSGCWLWLKAVDKDGYGKFNYPDRPGHKRHVRAHRFIYEATKRPIPDGLVTDHLCRVSCCVNPDHIEIVTPLENTRRGRASEVAGARNRAKTHCPRGHEYRGWNLMVYDGRRWCRACLYASIKRYKAKLKLQRIGYAN